MRDFLKFRLPIQLFAADDGGSGGSAGGEGENQNPPVTFTQADIDRAVSAAVATRESTLNATHQEQVTKAVADAIAEQQRLAALSEEERRNEARIAAEKALENRQRELNLKILRVDTGALLNEEGLSQDALELVLGADLESTKANVETLKGIINAGVEARVKELATKPGTPKGQNGKVLTKDEIMSIQDRTARQKAIEENIHLFTQ